MKTGYRRGTRILCAMIAAFFVIASIPSDIMAAETVQGAEQIVTAAEVEDQAEVFAGSSDDASDETEAEASAETDDADDELMGDPTDTATIYFNIGNCRVDEENMQGITDLEVTSSSNPDTWNGSGTVVARTLVIPFDVSDGYSLWDEYADATDYSIIKHNIRVECDGQEIDNYSFDDKNETLTINIPTDKEGKSVYVSAVAVGHKNMKFKYVPSMDPMPDKLEVIFTEGVDENGKSMGREIKGIVRLTSGDSTPVSKLLTDRYGYDPYSWIIGTDQNNMSNFSFERKSGNYVAEHEFTIPKEVVRAHEGGIGYSDWHGHENNEDIIVFLNYMFSNCSVDFRCPDFVEIFKYEIGEGPVDGQFPMESPITSIITHGERSDFHFCIGNIPDKHHVSSVKLVREVVDETDGTRRFVTKSLPVPVTETVAGETFTYYTIPAYEINTSINLVYVDVTVTADDEYVPEAFFVNDETSANTTVSFADECCSYSDSEGKVALAGGTVGFTYTVESKGKYVPSVQLGDVLIRPVSLEINEAGNGFICTFEGTGYTYAGKTLSVRDSEQNYSLDVVAEEEYTKTLDVKDENGTSAAVDEENRCFIVEPFKEYEVSMETLDGIMVKNFSVNGRRVNETYNGTVTVKIVPRLSEDIWSNGVDTNNVVSFSYESKLVGLVVKGVMYEDNSTVYMNDNEPFELIVTGTRQPGVKTVTAKQNNKLLEGFAVFDSETNTITINPSKAAAGKPVTVTVTGEANSGTADKKVDFTRKLNFLFRQNVTSVTLSGTGIDKNKKTITQELGTEMAYGIAIDGNVPFEGLGVTSDGNSEVRIDKTAKKLYVRTYRAVKDGGKDKVTLPDKDAGFSIGFTYDGTPIENAGFTVKCTTPAFAAPGVNAISVSDIGALVSLTAPKGTEKYKNVFFEVSAERTEGSDPFYDGVEPFYVSVNSLKANAVKLGFSDAEQQGKEHGKATYKVSAKLVQFNDVEGEEAGQESVCINSDKAKSKNLDVKTKEFAYEVKLSLAGKTTSFIRGQRDVLAAQAKFSGKTSVAELDYLKTYITDADGNKFADTPDSSRYFAYSDAGGIYLRNTSDFAVGTAVLTVYPKVPEHVQCAPASIKLTVKPPITRVSISPSQNRLYKAEGKASTMKFNAVLSSVGGKPASNKVKWEVYASSRLKNHISIKNGTVTVSKDFVPSKTDAEMNKFTVVLIADDYPSEEDRSDSLTVEIYDEPEKVSTIEVYDNDEMVDVDLSAADPNKLIGNRFVFKNENGTVINPENVSVKVTPNTMKLSPDGTVTSLTKDGVYKLSITSGDGSKAKTEKEIKVIPSAAQYDVKAYLLEGKTIDTINFEHLNFSGEGAILFVSERKDSCLANTSKFSVKGGKKINLGPYFMNVLEKGILADLKNCIVFAVKPSAEDVAVTFSPDGDKNNEIVYNMKNVAGGSRLTAGKTEIYANSIGTPYTFTFTTDCDEYIAGSEDDFDLRFDINESVLAAKKQADYDAAWKIMEALNDEIADPTGRNVVKDGAEKTISVKTVLDGIPKGSYKLDVTLRKGYQAVAKPITVTFKAMDAKAPKFSLKSDITMKDGDTKNLEFKSAANGEIVADSVIYMNNNAGGKINKFRDYFTVAQDADRISITQDGEPSDADRIGWIRYQVKGLDGRTVTFTDKVTVKQPK